MDSVLTLWGAVSRFSSLAAPLRSVGHLLHALKVFASWSLGVFGCFLGIGKNSTVLDEAASLSSVSFVVALTGLLDCAVSSSFLILSARYGKHIRMDSATTIWTRLGSAVDDRMDPMRQAVLCTEGGHGRMLVLREVGTRGRTMHFYSDARAGKLRQMGSAEAVFYDPELQWQIRARGLLTASGQGSQVDAAWEKLKAHGRENYRGRLAPGSVVSAAEDCARLAEHDGRMYFVRLTLCVAHLDALRLREKRRMQAIAHGSDDGWKEQWVQL